LVDVRNTVYNYLKRMQLMKIIPDYNSSDIPVSRGEVASYLITIKKNLNKLSSTDNKIFRDFEIEFEYDMYGTTKDRYSIISKENFKNIFDNNKQKNLYFYNDSNFTFFSDIFGSLSQRGSDGDSAGKNSILLGEFGFETHGTFYNSVGYFLGISNTQKLAGNDSDIIFAAETYPEINVNNNFIEKKNYSLFNGYLRYQTKSNWLALTFGRTQLNQGLGYIDKLFLSNNTLPFNFGNINLQYKSLKYSFTYGSLKGDSVGRPLKAKNIATHYLNINFSDAFKFGFWEAVITSNQPFSFTYLNPISFLTSADLSSGKDQTTQNNALIGFDIELVPFKNISFQSSLLIDDLTFGTLFKTDSLNENKFGWQLGALWTNSLNIKNMDLAVEFTHLDPFVYSHRTNKSTYTNYSLPLGHALPPNSDEIALKLSYDISYRLRFDFLFQHQRSGTGIFLDSAGNIIANYGGNINFGLGDAYLRTNGFLDGIRINRNIFTANIFWEPLKQFYLEGQIQYKLSDNLSYDYKFDDLYYTANLRIEL